MAHLVFMKHDRAGGTASQDLFKIMLLADQIGKATRQPFYDGARELLKLGYSPDEELTASHSGSATVAMRSTIGEAAKWTVHESDKAGLQRRPYEPMDAAALAARQGKRAVPPRPRLD